MSKTHHAAAAAVAALLFSATASAQVVGYPPPNSPYIDVRTGQDLTVFAGYFRMQKDEIGATPRSGPSFGLRYSVPVGGPAEFFVRAQGVSSYRESFNPLAPVTTRDLGRQSLTLLMGDLGFALNTTGAKSWHHLIPVVDAGFGVVTGGGSSTKDPYSFGTQFAINSDAGLRIVPGKSGWELRLTVGNSLFQSHYPTAYFTTPPSGGSPLLPTSTARSGFRTNWTYNGGLSIPIFR